MSVRGKKIHPALKHAGYSTATLLPGEDPDAFVKLQQDVIAEFQPTGPVEDDIVGSIARYLWRKKNLPTFRLAALARFHCARLDAQYRRKLYENDPDDEEDSAAQRFAFEQARKRARKELRETYELVEVGETATVEDLNKLLAIEEYLDGLIEKCIKRLLHVRGLKSVSSSSPSSPQQCIAAPKEG
jgi:hypothetical protein